jgi:hypothetical protein
MKNTSLVLGVIAIGAAGASIYLGVQLSATREALAQETEARTADAARMHELEGRLARMSSTRDSIPPAAPATGAPRPPAPEQRFADRRADGPQWGQRGENMTNIYNTPAGQNERRMQQEIRLRRMYADMPGVLKLDPVTAGKLYDLLTDAQLNSSGRQFGNFGSPGLDDATRTQRDTQIENLLGSAKAAEFQDFEKSIPARMQVGRIGESMAAANVPLSDAQRNSLIAAVYNEQQTAPPPQRTADMSDSDYQAQYLDWQADYSNRVQAAVQPLLSGPQATQYQQAVQVQNARRADMRARAEARRSNNQQ